MQDILHTAPAISRIVYMPSLAETQLQNQPSKASEHTASTAFILCGALAREVLAIVARHGWDVQIFGVTALDHMFPQRIAPDVEGRLRELIPRFARIVVIYGDCGTSGKLDETLARYNVPRIAGPHCYEMYSGPAFDTLMEEEPGTFFLTDFLVRGFEGTILRGLGLDRYPELRDIYFGNYRRLVYLRQSTDPALVERAQEISAALSLPLELRWTGYGLLEERLITLMAEIHDARFQPNPLSDDEELAHDNLPGALLARHPDPGARERRRRARQRSTP